MGLRISQSIRIGPLRVRVSAPVTGRGRTYVGVGKRVGRTWIGVSQPVGKGRPRRTR